MNQKLRKSVPVRSLLSLFFVCTVSLTNLMVAGPKPEKTNDNNGALRFFSIKGIYEKLQCPAMSFDAFLMAWNGFQQLKAANMLSIDSILTVVDFSKPSTENRMFIINTNTLTVVLQTLVAHGRNSGDVYAQNFSNTMSSYKSSLGLYITGNTYEGRNGYSLTLNGMEKGINDMARDRAIVVHGADYVSDRYVSQYGRIGRSFGCPAVSNEMNKTVINLIKDGSCMFLYHPQYAKMNGLATAGVGNALAELTH